MAAVVRPGVEKPEKLDRNPAGNAENPNPEPKEPTPADPNEELKPEFKADAPLRLKVGAESTDTPLLRAEPNEAVDSPESPLELYPAPAEVSTAPELYPELRPNPEFP